MILEGAACHGRDDLMMDPQRVAEAKTVCERCPAILACYEAAKAERFLWAGPGVWAGLSQIGRIRSDAEPVTGECSTCGTEFSYRPRTGRPRIYCTRRCSDRARRQPTMERTA